MAVAKNRDEDEDSEGPEHPGEWSKGLYGSCNCTWLLFSYVCPCCFICQIMQKLSPLEMPFGTISGLLASALCILTYVLGGYGGIFMMIFIYLVGRSIMDRYDIHEPFFVTAFKLCCCLQCYMMQMYAEVVASVGEDPPRSPPKKLFEQSLQDEEEETPLEHLRNTANFIVEEDDTARVRNHQFKNWLEEDRRHNYSCRTLPLTVCTYIMFVLVMYCHGNIDNTYRMQECLKGAIHEVKARHTVDGIGQSIKSVVNLTSVTSVDEMWSWIEGGLVPAMAGSPQKPGFVRTFNQVIGQIQLREERFEAAECQVGSDLASFYRQGCHSAGVISSDAYGSADTTSNTTDRAFLPAYGLGGQLSEFNAKRFFSWLDIRRPSIGQARANSLRTAKWIDDGSKSLQLTIITFNADIQAYGHVSVYLKLRRGGLIEVDMEVRVLWATMYTEWYHYVVDIVFLLLVLKFFANSLQKAVDHKDARNGFVRCCGSPERFGGGYWLGLDWLGLAVSVVLMVFLPVLISGFSNLATKVGKLGIGPDPLSGNATSIETAVYESQYGAYYATQAEIIEDLENLIELKSVWFLCMFWYSMVFLLRWFKGFSGQYKMAQITSTLASALSDLLHFALIFGVLFINFALSAHVIFGSEVKEWSTVPKALQSAIAMAYGRVEFTEMYEIAPWSSLLWLMLYVISIVFLSMNMLLAIITDHYGEVFHANNAGDKGDDIFQQIWANVYEIWWESSYVGRWLYKFFYEMFPTRVKQFKFTPQFDEEPERRPVPYEDLIYACEMDPVGLTTTVFLRREGCDSDTAKHLLKKCEDEVLRHLDEEYPLELLFDEFDENMQQYYFAMDTFSNELRTWFLQRSKEAANMLPRQEKLYATSTELQTKQVIEHVHHHHHSAETLEGPGAHHHHHRGSSLGGSNPHGSDVGSRPISRAESKFTDAS